MNCEPLHSVLCTLFISTNKISVNHGFFHSCKMIVCIKDLCIVSINGQCTLLSKI